jgi:catechol 2,3-dioxygenase-like lactoylglutathione lyase family enzyme
VTTAQELRFALTFEDYDAAVHLFRDVFGLSTLMDLEAQSGRGVILSVPSATLELFDRRHTDFVDGIEVGAPTGARVRIAVQVEDLDYAARVVADAGAAAVAKAVMTPWGDRNQRFRLPDGFQLTLFEPTETT